jgi:hypothetical protein
MDIGLAWLLFRLGVRFKGRGIRVLLCDSIGIDESLSFQSSLPIPDISGEVVVV